MVREIVGQVAFVAYQLPLRKKEEEKKRINFTGREKNPNLLM